MIVAYSKLEMKNSDPWYLYIFVVESDGAQCIVFLVESELDLDSVYEKLQLLLSRITRMFLEHERIAHTNYRISNLIFYRLSTAYSTYKINIAAFLIY